MVNQFFQPTEALRPYIRQYIYIHADGSTDTMAPPEGDEHFVNGRHVEKMLPSAGMLTLVRGAEVEVEGKVYKEDTIYIIGPFTRTFEIVTLHGWFEAITVIFKTGGMRAVLGYDMDKLKNKVSTTDMVADRHLHDLGMIIRQQNDPAVCVPMLDAFFVARLDSKYSVYEPAMGRVIRAIDESRGSLSVTEMASVANMSERQFRRVFGEYIGLTPKEFIRVWRFHQALQMMQQQAHAGKTIDLLEVAMRYGYYDLSHLATEFRALGCTTPNQFRKMGIPIQPDFSYFFA